MSKDNKHKAENRKTLERSRNVRRNEHLENQEYEKASEMADKLIDDTQKDIEDN